MTNRLRAWGPAAVWAAVLFFLSALHGLDGPPILFPGEDKVAHGVLYAVFGLLLARGRTTAGRAPPGWGLILLGVLYGASDEWHQSFVPGRDPSLGDWAADTAGVLLGYWIGWIMEAHGARPREARRSPAEIPGPQPE